MIEIGDRAADAVPEEIADHIAEAAAQDRRARRRRRDPPGLVAPGEHHRDDDDVGRDREKGGFGEGDQREPAQRVTMPGQMQRPVVEPAEHVHSGRKIGCGAIAAQPPRRASPAAARIAVAEPRSQAGLDRLRLSWTRSSVARIGRANSRPKRPRPAQATRASIASAPRSKVTTLCRRRRKGAFAERAAARQIAKPDRHVRRRFAAERRGEVHREAALAARLKVGAAGGGG